MKVLVTGAGALLGQGILRSLRRSTLDPEVVAVDPNPLSAGLYWADRAHLVPPAGDTTYIEALARVLDQERPDAVLVGTDVELAPLARARTELETSFGTAIVVSSPEAVEIGDDKAATAAFLQRNGFAAPRTVERRDSATLVEAVGYPLIVKPRRGARSLGVSLVHTHDELDHALATTPDAVVQEYVGEPGQEFTAGTLCFSGICDDVIVLRRDLRDGNTYRAWTHRDDTLEKTVAEMAMALDPFGPANFQFRLRDGEPVVFEINVRFSGTTPLRAHAGFNEVERTLRRVVLGEDLQPAMLRDVVVLRHWSETVLAPGDLIGG